jgi:hypothetical protein
LPDCILRRAQQLRREREIVCVNRNRKLSKIAATYATTITATKLKPQPLDYRIEWV